MSDTTRTATAGMNAEQARRMRTQLDTWRKDLVAVDRRQRLVYFKHQKVGSLEIATPTPEELLSVIASPARVRSELEPQQSRSLSAANKTATEVAASCRRLDTESKKTYADRGVWTLYLGVGMLLWAESGTEQVNEAPLVLVPVQLERSGAQSPYALRRYEDEDIIVNPALKLYLEREYSLMLPSVDVDDPDLGMFFGQTRALLSGKAGWSVQHRTVLSTFSFHKEPIYRDLSEHEANVLAHPVVQLVALGENAPQRDGFAFEVPGAAEPIDLTVAPEELRSILDADSSQRACILAARQGRSFVMDGPPGTGKSQTIANIIAELIADGKRVLFVSEKAAALDVVRDRLTAHNLGEFLLELHSHKATRKAVVQQLNDALHRRVRPARETSASERDSLRATRQELSDYAAAMNEIRSGHDASLHDMLGRATELAQYKRQPSAAAAQWGALDAREVDRLVSVAGRLANAWRPAKEGRDFLWRDTAMHRFTVADLERARSDSAQSSTAARELVRLGTSVDATLYLNWPLTLADSRRRVTLLETLQRRPDVPIGWLTNEQPQVLAQRVNTLRRAADKVAATRTELVSLLSQAGAEEIDPDRASAIQELGHLPGMWNPDPTSTATSLRATHEHLAASAESLSDLSLRVRQIGGLLGIDVSRIGVRRALEIAELAALGSSPTRPEAAWLNPSVQAALDESMRVLSLLVEVVNDRREAMETVFKPEALQADLQGLNVRFQESHKGLRSMGSAARADRRLLKSITVNGKADKVLRARLDEAVAWQKAESNLAQAEAEHASSLGSYYQRTATDFGRVSEAINIARRAIELAGNDLNAGPMAQQLGRDGSADPQLILVAQQVHASASTWMEATRKAVGAEVAATLFDVPLDVAVTRCLETQQALQSGLEALEYEAGLAQRDLTVVQGQRAQVVAGELATAQAAVYDTYEEDQALLGSDYQGLATEWKTLEAHLAWLDEFQQALGAPATQRQADAMLKPMIVAKELDDSIAAWERARDVVLDWFTSTRSAELRADLDGNLEDAAEVLEDMRSSSVTDLQEWQAYNEARSILADASMGPLVEELAVERVDAADVAPTVERALVQARIEAVVSTDPRLATFRSSDRDALVERFRQADAELINRASASVVHACNARRPSSALGGSTQLIRREAAKKSRHLAIRDLLDRTQDVVQDLKPCFMMSPLSVSQFLPGSMTFDVVIFDEASQVLPSDAVNCIYRAEQLIVAGDEKQLPPTSFFSAVTDDDDIDEELDIFESVLKSCKSALPSLPLTWHYRSQHESLITYSNRQFYAPDGQALQTFPSATYESPDLGVEAFIVNGEYQKGTSRDNPVEAEAVVDRILFHREAHPDLSLGVVTFSAAQERAVSAALEARAMDEPLLAELLDDHDRLNGFFVKNLENVQGDERDLIIFSVGYGPDPTGAFSMNFGPVTRSGGWRRLNVAVTRARRRVEVVASFRAAQMREGANESLAALKGYLEFAERRGKIVMADAEHAWHGEDRRDLVDDVVDAIESLGYVVEKGVGAAGYRLDIAVRHPDRPGEYLMAVECDGASYASAESARDRDRLRGSVLARLGWRTHRVWSVQWYRDRENELSRLRDALTAAGHGTIPLAAPTPVPEVHHVEEIDLNEQPSWAVPYRAHRAQQRMSWDDLGSVHSRSTLQVYLRDLLVTEAPVHRDLVHQRIRDAFGVGRIGSNIKDNIEWVVERITVNGSTGSIDSNGFFRLGDRMEVRHPTGRVARKVSQVPPEEIELAVTRMVSDARVVAEEDLIPALARLFGWQRAGADIRSACLAAVDRCVSAGMVKRNQGGDLSA